MTEERSLQEEAEEVQKFLLEHYPETRQWKDLRGYLLWYMGNGFLVSVRDKPDGEIYAVGTARPVEDPRDGEIPFRYDENGQCIFVDFVVRRNEAVGQWLHYPDLAFPMMSHFMRHRFGERRQIAYFRRHGPRIKVMDFARITKKVERIL